MADDIERVRQAALKDPAQLVRFADLLVASGRSDEAVQACRKGLVQRPDDVPLRLALGRALSAAGHLEEAQAALLDAVARQQRSGRSMKPAAKPPADEEDSGPVIADPSIEEVIELETRVGRTAGDTPGTVGDAPSFSDDAPTSIVEAEELPRLPRRNAAAPTVSPKSAPRDPAPGPGDRPRVTTLPSRTPARGSVPAGRLPDARPSEPVGRRSDRVTTLPARGASDRGERAAPERPAAEVPEPEARAWASPPSQPLEIEPAREERRSVPRPRSHEPAPRVEAAELQARRRATPEPRRPPEPELASEPPPPSRPRMTAPSGPPGRIDLLASARGLLGQVAPGDEAQPVDVLVAPPVADEMTRAWDARRARSFVWLWVALVLLSGTGAASYVYRSRERARLLAIAVERADARALEATADGDFAARDAYAGALRAEPKMRKYAAMVANAAARLSTDHGEDTDSAAWAMLKRAEKEAQRKPDATPDPRTERDLRQARGLLALGRGETCPPLEEKDDGEIAARCALQRGDTDAARRILADTLKATGDAKNARALIALASLELGAGDLDAADAAYNKILSAYPGHPRAMVGRLLVAIERGESPKIPETLPGSGRLGLTTESWFHLARGLTALNAKTTDAATREQAAAELELARRGILHDGRLALLYGRACLLEGKVAEAEQAMRIAERLNPNDADVAVLDAEVALAKGYEEKVVSALSVGAQTPRKLAVLGRAQALTGRYKEAAATLDAALVKRPGDAVSITYRAIARAHLGDAAGAQRELEKAANTLSSSTPRYGLGLLAYERRDLVRARTELDKALAGQNAEAFRARALLGRVLRDLGKTQEALAELERVAREAPALLLVHSALGRLYLDLGRDRDARTELRQVIDGGNPSMDDRVAFATALVNLGAVDQGEHAINDAVEAGVPATRVQRLRLELQSWKGPKEALIAAKALEKERKGPAAKDTSLTLSTAHAFRRAGDYKRASELYREALLGDPLHANLGIGRIQLAQNDNAGAESSFRAALDVIGKGQSALDDETEARIGLARALLSRKASSEAAKVLEAAVEKDDLSAEAHYQLARAYQEKNDLEKARTQAERAAGLDDTYADAFVLIGDLNRTSSPERAKSAYKKYLELQPDGEHAKTIKKAIEKLR
jgi:tetratricopeptide (TPR) repeat protein